MKKLTLNKINFAGATELTREQLKKVMGGNGGYTTQSATPSGCIVYTIEESSSGTVRTVDWNYGEYGTGEDAEAAASSAAVETGNRYGYDCPDDNGAYEHEYIW